MPSGSARPRSTSMVCGKQRSDTRNTLSCPAGAFFVCTRWNIVIASAAAVPSSSSDAVAMSIAGQVVDDGLEVQQRLEPALRDLGLIRRVGRVPAGFSNTLRRITLGVMQS